MTAIMISYHRFWKVTPGLFGMILGLLVLIPRTQTLAAGLTALDKYVAKPDTNYHYRLLNTTPGETGNNSIPKSPWRSGRPFAARSMCWRRLCH